MKKKMKQKENLNCVLPDELMVWILLRLPVRSLVRFRCVCSSWRSLVSNPQFAKSHFDLAASPTHRLLLKRINDGSEVESLDLKTKSLNDDSAVVNLKFPPYTARNFLTLGSCRGLLLLTDKKDPSLDDLIVWNPSTGAQRKIPATYDNWDSWYNPSTPKTPSVKLLYDDPYGFGYDPSNDDYLLVVIRLCEFLPEVTNQIGVLSVKTNVTSFYGVGVEYMPIGPWTQSGLYLNQSLHWSVTSMVTQLDVIIVFDLVERSLSEILLPPDLDEELANYDAYHLGVLGGCLSLCYSGRDLSYPGEGDNLEITEIWVMKEYKVQSSWTKSFVISVQAMRFLPIWSTEGGGVLGSDDSGGLQNFNDKGELLEKHAYGIEDIFGLKYFDMYRESLLTLPGGDFKEENEDA